MATTQPTIIFDLDGTLIDSAPDVCRALNRTLRVIGRRDHAVDEVKTYLGQGARILVERALATTGEVPEDTAIDRLTEQFLADYAMNPVVDSFVFPGVLEALGQLSDRGALLAICTNKPSITCEPVLEVFGLNEFFSAIVCPDHVQHKKPDGRHILDTISLVGGSPERAIMIGDSENDIHAAINAGIPSIAVTFGYSGLPHAELGATILIDHFDQLVPAIDAIMPTG